MQAQNTQQKAQQITSHHDEQILVVKRELLFADECWQGLNTQNAQKFLSIIEQEKEFLPRSQMEMDPRYKQVIPYLVFCHNDTYFLMQRTGHTTEQRLKNKFSLGIGGHIRQEDISGSDIVAWARREFEEEVSFDGSYTVEPLGILNDDSNSVGEVHVGFVFLLKGSSANISVKSELKSGELLDLEACELHYSLMESWSQIVLDALKSK